MEALHHAFQLTLSPDSHLRAQGQNYLQTCDFRLILQSIWDNPATSLQAALYLKVTQLPIAAELQQILFNDAVQTEEKVKNVLSDLFATLCMKQWPQNYEEITRIFVDFKINSTHLAVFRRLKTDKSSKFYIFCEFLTSILHPSLHFSDFTDILFSLSSKFTKNLPISAYSLILTDLSSTSSQFPHWESLLLRRIRLFPTDLMPFYPQIIAILLSKLQINTVFSLRGFTYILNNAIFSENSVIFTENGEIFPCPFFTNLPNEKILEIVDFVMGNCLILTENWEESEEFENKKYDLRPCSADFLLSLYKNSNLQLQNVLKLVFLRVLLTPIDQNSPLNLLFQVIFM